MNTQIESLTASIEEKNNRVVELQKQIQALATNIQKAENDVALTFKATRDELKSSVAPAINFLKKEFDALKEKYRSIPAEKLYDENGEHFSDMPIRFGIAGWESFLPIKNLSSKNFPKQLLIGEWRDSKNIFPPQPAFVKFFDANGALVIETDNTNRVKAQDFLRALAQRIHLMMPHYAKFTLYDPVGNDSVFGLHNSVETRSAASEYNLFDEINADIARINRAYALSQRESFAEKIDSLAKNEKMEFIFATAFPSKPDQLEAFSKIAANGHIAGKYVIVLHNKSVQNLLTNENLERGLDKWSLLNFNAKAKTIDITKTNECESFNFEPLKHADSTEFDRLNGKLKSEIKRPQHKIDFKEHSENKADYWNCDSKDCIEAIIGDSNGRPLSVWFGDKDGIVCHHGVLAGTTGSGKSNTLHAIILSLAQRYNPRDLRLYLVDGKFGSAFKQYRNLPHAEVVSEMSSSGLAGSILESLVKEMARRNEYFKTVKNGEHIGVENYPEYCNCYNESMGEKLPRILLIIDEYQVLFDEDNAAKASTNLNALCSQARSAGISVFISSQRYKVPNIQNKDSIFSNIGLRMAMKMDKSDLFEIPGEKEMRDAAASCDIEGKIVINTKMGSNGANTTGRVALVENKGELVSKIIEYARQQEIPERLMSTILFEGGRPPIITENPLLLTLAKAKYPSDKDMQTLARKPAQDRGFGCSRWNFGEVPLIAWIGQEFNMYGQAAVVFKRRRFENVVIIGTKNEARYGMLLGILSSLLLNRKKDDVSFYIYDRSMRGSEWNGYLQSFSENILKDIGYKVNFSTKATDISNGLKELNEVFKTRLAMDQDERFELKPIFLVVTEPEELEQLTVQVDANGIKKTSDDMEIFKNIYAEGPSVGIYTIASSAGVALMDRSIPAKNLKQFFNHKILLQMSREESLSILGNSIASDLQDSSGMTVAYYMDDAVNEGVKFKPYDVSVENFDNQLEEIKSIVKDLNG